MKIGFVVMRHLSAFNCKKGIAQGCISNFRRLVETPTGAARRGPDGLERLFLHAWKLELASPSGEGLIRAEAPLPEELEVVLERLRDVEGMGRVRGGPA